MQQTFRQLGLQYRYCYISGDSLGINFHWESDIDFGNMTEYMDKFADGKKLRIITTPKSTWLLFTHQEPDTKKRPLAYIRSERIYDSFLIAGGSCRALQNKFDVSKIQMITFSVALKDIHNLRFYDAIAPEITIYTPNEKR